MDIIELDQKLKQQKKICSGGSCFHILELPGGIIYTDNFKTYQLYNRVQGKFLVASRKEVMEGLRTLGMTEEQVKQEVDKKDFKIGLSTIAVVGAVAILVIILLTQK